MLSIISLVAYVLTKIAVGIFAGGVVFATLMPELNWTLGPFTLNSFWIGSVLVILLTGLYTVLGGLRAVAYTEAMQTIILIIGSLLVTVSAYRAVGRLGRAATGSAARRCSISGSRWSPRRGGNLGPGHGTDADGT